MNPSGYSPHQQKAGQKKPAGPSADHADIKHYPHPRTLDEQSLDLSLD
ncbi:hypothetical protein ABZ379_08280 [Streptomyces canus]